MAEEYSSRTPIVCSYRLVLSVLSFFGFVNLYGLRFSTNVVLECMVNDTAVKVMEARLNSSSASELKKILQHQLYEGEFDWSRTVQTMIHISFYWGYVFTQIPGGLLAQRYGGKKFFGWSMFLSGAITLLIPVAARIGYTVLIVLRIFLGLCQGVIWPAALAIWSRWAPPLERQRLAAGSFSGVALGVVGTYPLTAVLCNNEDLGGWESVFFISGSFAIIWCFIWSLYAYDTPDEHPHISMEERMYIQRTLIGTVKMFPDVNYRTPWECILTCRPFWALVVAQTCSDLSLNFLVLCGYSYMHNVLNLKPQETGSLMAVPYFGFFLVSIISAVLYDYVAMQQTYSTTTARKISVSLALLIQAVLVLCLGFLAHTHRVAGLILACTGIAAAGLHFGAGYLTIVADIAPSHAAIMIGISNTIAPVSALIFQSIATYIVGDNDHGKWQMLFLIISAVNVFGCIVFIIWGSGELQYWARVSIDESTITDSSSRLNPNQFRAKDSSALATTL